MGQQQPLLTQEQVVQEQRDVVWLPVSQQASVHGSMGWNSSMLSSCMY